MWLNALVLLFFHYTSSSDYGMHPNFGTKLIEKRSLRANPEETAAFWIGQGEETLRKKLALKRNENVAKNVILFLGDGMSIPTISATRAYMGGEEKQLSFDSFPYTALSKTYCVDNQVADSACSATAYLCGVKANLGTIGVTASIPRASCPINTTHFVHSIAHWSQSSPTPKSTGLVTTARVTHASPAGVYAHTSERDWESDRNVIDASANPDSCPDIAAQLIFGATGRRLNVILGGGRSNFLPAAIHGPDGVPGARKDNQDLIKTWRELHPQGEYVWNASQLRDVDANSITHLLGLFTPEHMSFNMKRDPNAEPSLAEMTEAAIAVMRDDPNGFFLFVEGARIDMAHHGAKAHLALNETVEFSKAVQRALDLTDAEETLIVVTSDHAHTMSYSGYGKRGRDVLGVGGKGMDEVPYTVLSYANGPGYKQLDGGDKHGRHDVTKDDMHDPEYQYPGLVPLPAETHGGDDVGIFALGPWAHLFGGVMEENVIPLIMKFASCVGDGQTACDYINYSRKEEEQTAKWDKPNIVEQLERMINLKK